MNRNLILIGCGGLFTIGLGLIVQGTWGLYKGFHYKNLLDKRNKKWALLSEMLKITTEKDNKLYKELIDNPDCPEDLMYSCKKLLYLNNEILEEVEKGPSKVCIQKVESLREDYNAECEEFKKLKEKYISLWKSQLENEEEGDD